MSEVFLWNYPRLWNRILTCAPHWYSFRFFEVQFSQKKNFFLFNFPYLLNHSALILEKSAINFVKHSTRVSSQKNTQPLSHHKKVPFPQFWFTFLVLAFILWVFWQTLIYFLRIYRKFCICNMIGDFPAVFWPNDFLPKFCKKISGIVLFNHYTQSFSVSCRATACLFGPFYI